MIVDALKRFLQECEQEHEQCQPCWSERPSIKPKRYLDVSRITEGIVQVVLSEDVPADSKYMTLSHRWGSAPPLKLVSANEKKLM